MAGGLLSSLGMTELVTQSLSEYESRACELAREPAQLRGLRHELLRRRASHPFFDTDGYRRYLEAAYVAMHRRHTEGQRPAPIVVPPAV
jgi:predicted O-linked N-acetylglucosamine transferase (SPINDLY family)